MKIYIFLLLIVSKLSFAGGWDTGGGISYADRNATVDSIYDGKLYNLDIAGFNLHKDNTKILNKYIEKHSTPEARYVYIIGYGAIPLVWDKAFYNMLSLGDVFGKESKQKITDFKVEEGKKVSSIVYDESSITSAFLMFKLYELRKANSSQKLLAGAWNDTDDVLNVAEYLYLKLLNLKWIKMDFKLTPTNDQGKVDINFDHENYYQTAIRRGNYIKVSKQGWLEDVKLKDGSFMKKLDPLNRAALIFHEVIYKILERNETSESTQYYTALLFKRDIRKGLAELTNRLKRDKHVLLDWKAIEIQYLSNIDPKCGGKHGNRLD